MEPADGVEEKRSAGLGGGQMAELVEDHVVEAAGEVGGAALTTAAGLGVERVHEVDAEVDAVEDAPAGAATASGADDADGEVIVYRERTGILASFGDGDPVGSSGGADGVGHGVACGDEHLGLGNGDLASLPVAEDAGLAASRDAEDAVRKTVGDGAEGLLVMVALRRHEPPADLGQTSARSGSILLAVSAASIRARLTRSLPP